MVTTSLLIGQYHYWVYAGILYLIILTYQDYKSLKNKDPEKRMLVDTRFNYVMMGLTFSLLSHFSVNFFYLLALIVVVTILYIFMKQLRVIGEADAQSITWAFIGFGIIALKTVIWYLLIFIVLTIIYNIFKFAVFKYREATPYYFIVLLSFFLNCIIFGLI